MNLSKALDRFLLKCKFFHSEFYKWRDYISLFFYNAIVKTKNKFSKGLENEGVKNGN